MCGYRTTPPEIGNIGPSSAYVRPISRIITPAMSQEKIAAGPAIPEEAARFRVALPGAVQSAFAIGCTSLVTHSV
jgi:hypothetical protein